MIALLAIAAGCQTEPAARPHSSDGASKIDDPCANQLHDLCDYLAQYYAVEKHLPPNLQALAPLIDPDKRLPLICPVSGKAYQYNPNGLVAPGDPRELLVFDATPCHDGKREAIVANPPGLDVSHPFSLWVVQIPEKAFKLYHPRGQ